MHTLFRYELKCFAILSESASQKLANLLRKTIVDRGITQCSIISFTEELYEQKDSQIYFPTRLMEISSLFYNDQEAIAIFIPLLLETLDILKRYSAFTEEYTILALINELKVYSKNLDSIGSNDKLSSEKTNKSYKHSFRTGLRKNEEEDLYRNLIDDIIKKGLGSNEKLIHFIGGSEVNVFTDSHVDFSFIKNDPETLYLFIQLVESIIHDPSHSYGYNLKPFLAKLKLLHKAILTNITLNKV